MGSSIGLWLLLVLLPAGLAMLASMAVRAAFNAGLKVEASCGLTGAEVTAEILRAHNLTNVRITEVPGTLSDHYDPRTRTLALSSDVYHGRSVAALGVAAHEAGHALQHATNYGPLALRNGIVPLAMVGQWGIYVVMLGLMLTAVAGKLGLWVALMGVAMFSIVLVFQLINLIPEFDASNRARQLLQGTGLVAAGAESAAMNRVLSAAAMTYVAATIAALGTVIYYVIVILGNSRR